MSKERNYGLIAALLTISVLLAGCGIKPRDLDPPPGVEKNDFPRHYPSGRTDE